MIDWIIENLSTIIISLILIIIVTIIVINLRNKRKKGISDCGSNCEYCSLNSSCLKKSQNMKSLKK